LLFFSVLAREENLAVVILMQESGQDFVEEVLGQE